MLRRFLCTCNSGGASTVTVTASAKKKNVVFLGSPQVSASVLDKLILASQASHSIFKLAAVVTQPPSVRDRGRKNLMPSPVAQLALDKGFPQQLIFTPHRAGEENFLSNLKGVNPDLCITAAYGNILPQRFLDIPPCGTVNIHPSLLPLYRGAAPVQRALQDGVTETGVSLAYTIRALDAGPVIAYEKFQVDDSIKAPELLSILFDLGSGLLIRELPFILDGSAKVKALPQDDSKATLAPKLTSEESWLSFDQEAPVLHNKVRAFTGWPGTRAKIQVANSKTNGFDLLDIKVISTRVCHKGIQSRDKNEILFSGDALQIPCAGESWLEVTELQLPGKKVMRARDFWNGLRGQKLKLPSQLEILA
ncbi:Methionyl-tRNA formyltransferase [Rhynchospora pubera]|uniref:Methionyl-tRNA formyltransferase, mitochondrial n=1 Tax=Rhynchospora pubera TaxID=906938 RepID=A0AAV8DK48_9POAL|nr:Methionyl-tRNA formyltransferase [Rhynchospora pubera]